MAGMTALAAPSGKTAMVARNQASRKRGTGVEAGKIGRRRRCYWSRGRMCLARQAGPGPRM
jgi:hypothetical protein